MDYVNRANSVVPNHPSILSPLRDILLLKKRSEPVLKALLGAECFDDGSEPTRFYIGSAYLASEAFDDAKHYFDQVLVIDARIAAAYMHMGLAELSLMNLERAINKFDSALLRALTQTILMRNEINLMSCWRFADMKRGFVSVKTGENTHK